MPILALPLWRTADWLNWTDTCSERTLRHALGYFARRRPIQLKGCERLAR
jgi:hypothetical protein